MLVLVGMLSLVWHLVSYIPSYSLINSNAMVTTRLNLVWYRFCLSQDLYLILYYKENINFVAGLGSWWGISSHWEHDLGGNSNEMVTTRPDLGWYRYGLVANLQFIVFKSRHKLWSRVFVLVVMLSQVRHLLSYILYFSWNSDVMVITRPNLGWCRLGLNQDL